MIVTYLIIGFTVLVSFMAFNNQDLFIKMKHWPYQEARDNEFYRWLTGGFLHADPMHLIFNMLTLYFFGANQGFHEGVEGWFEGAFPEFGTTMYLIFYLSAIVAASSATYSKHKNNPAFASIGASGAVAAILFASILLYPTNRIMLMILPIPIPGYLFGILYLWYSSYAAKRGGDNIDHTAHFFGAVFGFFVPIILKPSLFADFIAQITG